MEAAFWYLLRLLSRKGREPDPIRPVVSGRRQAVAVNTPDDRVLCLCSCHDAFGCGVDVRDVIEAATACRYCVDDHCPALLDYKPPHPWTPEKDQQADGEGKE